jgi:hypothetical protein
MHLPERVAACEIAAIHMIRNAHLGMPPGEAIEVILDACHAVANDPADVTAADVDAVGNLTMLAMAAVTERAKDDARALRVARECP